MDKVLLHIFVTNFGFENHASYYFINRLIIDELNMSQYPKIIKQKLKEKMKTEFPKIYIDKSCNKIFHYSESESKRRIHLNKSEYKDVKNKEDVWKGASAFVFDRLQKEVDSIATITNRNKIKSTHLYIWYECFFNI